MKNENSSRLECKTPKASQNESFGRTMKKSAGKKIALTIYLLGFAGALLFIILLIREGAHDVVRAVAATGWWLDQRPFRLCGRTQPHLGANEKNESDAGSRTAILGE